MASFGTRCSLVTLVLMIACCLMVAVNGNQEQARNYQNFINHVRGLVSHPYRDHTAVMTGGRTARYVSLNPLTSSGTEVELILSRRNLYVIGYRTRENNQRVAYLFSDASANELDRADYDRAENLAFGGSYTDLERFTGQRRQDLRVSARTLEDGIRILGQAPSPNTNQQRAEIMFALVMVVSEGARFNDISNAFRDRLRDDGTWRATDRNVGLMNSWDDLSTFIIDNSQDVTGSSSQWFPNLNEQVTLRAALAMMAVILRCFQRTRRTVRQTTPAECRIGVGVDAALADGTNQVYLFNGPNFVHIRFTPGQNDDRIIGGIQSIYSDWPFLRGTEFVKGLDAAFRVPNSNEAYIFRGGDYALIDIARKQKISGPKSIWNNWPSLNPTVFSNGVDAAFASIRKDEVYLFRFKQYALVNFAPGTSNDYIVNGPHSIKSSWSSLQNTAFVDGFDAAFALSDKTVAYLFKKDEYVRIDYAPGTNNDHMIGSVQKIRDGWPSLKNTAFDV